MNLIKILLAFICIFASTLSLQAQLPKLIPYNKDGKWGYSDSLQNIVIPYIVIPCEYEEVKFFKNGYAVVTGNCEIIRNENYVYDGGWCGTGRSPEFFRVCKKGVINEEGKIVVPMQYESIENFNEAGVAIVRNDGKFGRLKKSGKIIIPIKYDNITIFDGYFKVMEGKSVLFYNSSGKKIDKEYNQSKKIAGHLTKQKNKENSIPQKPLAEFKSEHIEENDFTQTKNDTKYGIETRQGKEIIPPIYDRIKYLKNGLIAVEMDGLWGIRDLQNNEIIPCEYGNMEIFGINLNDPHASTLDKSDFVKIRKNGRWGLLSKDGKQEIISAKHNCVCVLSDSLFIARISDRRYEYYNRKGKVIAVTNYMNPGWFEWGSEDFDKKYDCSLRDLRKGSLIRTDEGFIDIYGNAYFENKYR